MRIDVITLHAVQNYGSVLQAFATEEFFRRQGCDTRLIHYVREDVHRQNLLREWSRGNPCKALAMLPTIWRWERVFGGFMKKHLHLTQKTYTGQEDFHDYPLTADAYCTGSDQVWNSVWNRGILPCLYLDFIPKGAYKFAFAASFGQSRIDKEEVALTRGYLEQYRKLSVRESSAGDILRQQYGIAGARHILDPTLCLSPEEWREHTRKGKNRKDYILVYNLNRSREFDLYAVKLAKHTGLPLYRLCTRYDQLLRPGKSILIPEVWDFVSLIDEARYVLTDSFHATAFALNLGTEPICVYPKAFAGRLESLLCMTGTQQRRIKDYEDFGVLRRPVDFAVVEECLAKEREKAAAFLQEVLSDIEAFAKEREANADSL